MLRMVRLTGEARRADRCPRIELTYLDAAENKRVWAFVHDMEDASLLVVSGSEPDRQVEPADSALVQRWDKLRRGATKLCPTCRCNATWQQPGARAGGGARAFG